MIMQDGRHVETTSGEVFLMNGQNIADGVEEVEGVEFRSSHVFPSHEGEFEYPVLDNGAIAFGGLNEAGDDFNVEDPAGEKWFGEDGREGRGGPKKLGPALGVIDWHAEDEGDSCGE